MKVTNDSSAYGFIIFIMVILLAVVVFGWLIYFNGALYSENRDIIASSVEYHSFESVGGTYTEIRIVDNNMEKYEYSLNKHTSDNDWMMANINNGWSYDHNHTIEHGGKYRITIWKTIFGGYTRDPFSNWNSNPEISKIVRLD